MSLILIGFIILLLIIVYFVLWKFYKWENFTRTSLSTFLNEADNGDLLFLSGTTFPEQSIKFWTCSQFSHVALIFKEDNETYLWEADSGQGYRSGPRVIRVKDKLDRWKGKRVAGWCKLKGTRPTTKQILDVVAKYVTYDMDTSLLVWMLPFIGREKNKIFCSEVVALTLQHTNKLDKNIRPTSFSPKSLMNEKEIYDECRVFEF
jgi:hypothetical protein